MKYRTYLKTMKRLYVIIWCISIYGPPLPPNKKKKQHKIIIIIIITHRHTPELSLSLFLWLSIWLEYHNNWTRLGEWGDHVTLQAAADRVSKSQIISSTLYFVKCSFFFGCTTVDCYAQILSNSMLSTETDFQNR